MARNRTGSRADKPTLPKTVLKGVKTRTPTSGEDPDRALRDPNKSYFNQSMQQIRTDAATDDRAAIRLLTRVHGDVGAAVGAQVRLANTPLKITAYEANHQVSSRGNELVRFVLARLDVTTDYTKGYDDRMALASVKESLLKEVPQSGSCGLELVLDEQRLPSRLMPIPVRQITWQTGKEQIGNMRKVIPSMQIDGVDTPLDFPTIFYAALDQDPENVYSRSPLEPALHTSIFHAEVVEDIRRVVRRSGHSRLMVKLDIEKVIQSAPPNVRQDADKLIAFLDEIREQVKDEVEGLTPESALVYYDTVNADYLHSQIGDRADYGPLMETIDGLQSTALRTPPSILGKRMGGSQNTSSTESLLFIKTAEGLQPPVETVLTRALTLAIRLFGFDGYVKAEFTPINLRPDDELEAFKIMKQQRVLELLSLGFITDDEAAEEMGTGPRAPNAPELSGTMFYRNGGVEEPSPNGDPARRALVPDAPSKAGGESQ